MLIQKEPDTSFPHVRQILPTRLIISMLLPLNEKVRHDTEIALSNYAKAHNAGVMYERGSFLKFNIHHYVCFSGSVRRII